MTLPTGNPKSTCNFLTALCLKPQQQQRQHLIQRVLIHNTLVGPLPSHRPIGAVDLTIKVSAGLVFVCQTIQRWGADADTHLGKLW